MKRPGWKHVRWAASIALVGGVVAAALWPEPLTVDVAQASRGPLEVTLDEDGDTRVLDRFVVSAPVAGRLQRIELEPGDDVVKGRTVVARLAPAAPPLLDPRARAELTAAMAAANAAADQARAERDRAAAVLERARSALRRQQSLSEAGAVSRDDFESAQTAVMTAESALHAATMAVARADQESRLARSRLQTPVAGGGLVDVKAPVDGIVLRRLRESEAVVPAGEGLVELGDPQRLEIVSDLLSTDAVQVKHGSAVRIEQWGGNHPLAGKVRRVEPAGFIKVSALGVEERRVNVVIDLSDPAAAARSLGDGYRVEVRIVLWQADDVLKVPIGTLFRRGNDWAVFVVVDGRAVQRTVQIGHRNNEDAEITGGLEDGDAVVLHPPDSLTDGARIEARRRG
jgi:HlyD family secretion protein